MADVKLTINGIEMTADSGKTILQVVRERGLDHIPTLCYEERLGHITSCFLCVVEVEGARGLVPSCSTKVTEGMVVRTASERVREARRTCLELLFSDHNADCISPCSMKCPAGVDIQGYIALVKSGRLREAVELIRERNPLPIVCGRVCVRACEVGCRRAITDEAVAIDWLKRHAAESKDARALRPSVKSPSGKSVAVVGGGPAGLSAAYYLAQEGHEVTIFEAMPRAGGMLRYGIPAYRLPKNLLDDEIALLEGMGVKILCSTRLGGEITMKQLEEKYHAVILAPGAWSAMGLNVENESAKGVHSGLDVLREAALGTLRTLEGRVLVIGGGNTAIDASRTAVRLGAARTTIIYRRTESEMPAHHEEVEGARREGVELRFLTAPVRVVADESGKVTGLECIRMELSAPDASGRPKPVPVEGSNFVVPCEVILAAIGQFPELSCTQEHANGRGVVAIDRAGRILCDGLTMETRVPDVFAAGDCVTGPATVIEAIAGGRRAAMTINARLSGTEARRPSQFGISREPAAVGKEEISYLKCSTRHAMPEREAAACVRDFDEVELGLAPEAAVEESKRCLGCGCLAVDECKLRRYGEEYKADPRRFKGEMNRYPVDRRHPFIVLDPNKCIRCGRCIRTCEAVMRSSALGFVNRGFSSILAPAMEKPLLETGCISCGNCIDACPTGAICEQAPLFPRADAGVQEKTAVCGFCSLGCRIAVKTYGTEVRFRAARDPGTGQSEWLCSRGRFAQRCLATQDRLTTPSVRAGGALRPASWDEALERTRSSLQDLTERYGPEALGVFLSPKLTNEEIRDAVSLARDVLGTDNVASYEELVHGRSCHELDGLLGRTASTTTMESLERAKSLVLINADPAETHPALAWKIRAAVRRGARLVVINSNRIDAVSDAALWLQPRKGTNTHLLNAIMHEILRTGSHEGAEPAGGLRSFLEPYSPAEAAAVCGVPAARIVEAAGLIASAIAGTVALYDFAGNQDRSTGDLAALASLLRLTGNAGAPSSGLLLLTPHCNSAGLHALGAGCRSGEIREKLLAGDLRGALIIGEDPLAKPGEARYLRGLEFLAVVDLFMTETARSADVVLPGSASLESGGSLTRFDGTVQRFEAALPPRAGRTTAAVLQALAGRPLPAGERGETPAEAALPGEVRLAPWPVDTATYPAEECALSALDARYREEVAHPCRRGKLAGASQLT